MDDEQTPRVADTGEVIDNPWQSLRALTPARIALGRTGVSQPTRHHLAFQLAHAQARDAVHSALDIHRLSEELQSAGHQTLELSSAAGDRGVYLQRPDLGRQLDPLSLERLPHSRRGSYDVAFVIADGLSALAVQRHAVPLLAAVMQRLDIEDWRVAPLTIVQHGRVAISDEIGGRLGANLAVVLIGERPGLSSPDSLGVYLTYHPRVGNTDADRNCISNIHSAGLSYDEAAQKLVYLMLEAHRRELSGVALKDDSASLVDVEVRKLPRQHT